MLKKLALPIVAVLALTLFLAVPQASARVHFGVTVGAPIYTYPVTPYYDYSYAYPAPYVAPYPYYSYPRVYTYSRPYYYFGGTWGGHERHEWREHLEHERHEFREHHR